MEFNRKPHFMKLNHVDWHVQRINGSRVKIKRRAAYAVNCFANLWALKLLSVECDLLDKNSYDNIIDNFYLPKNRKCLL